VWQGPYGYSSNTAGLMGATLLLAGLVCAAATAPLFDRVLTRHLAWTCKALCPVLAALWLSLVWAGAHPLSLPFSLSRFVGRSRVHADGAAHMQ
jgi:hypothetical protein